MSQISKPLKRRNALHAHPLLGKGAAHGKTSKAKRRGEKVALKQDRSHYLSPLAKAA
jgi:hypothetical protein